MAKVPDTRMARLVNDSTELAPMGNDPERTLCSANTSFQTAFANLDMSRYVDDQVGALEQASEADEEDPILVGPWASTFGSPIDL